MKTSVKFTVALLAIAMMATTNNTLAQTRSNSGRSGQSRVQQESRSAAGAQVRQDNRQDNRNAVRDNKGGQMAGQISHKEQAKVDKKQDKVDRQQMPAGKDRQPDLNHKVDQARQNNQLKVPYRPEKHRSMGHVPMMAPPKVLTPHQIKLRTNATTLVVYTDFRTKAEAYAYVSNLMFDRYYYIDTYDTSYGWFNTSMTAIPTPHGWADPRAANQFRIRFDFKRYGGRIKILITAQWRESMLGGPLYNLRYQPSDQFSTYYAWNILEDIAWTIPNYRVDFL